MRPADYSTLSRTKHSWDILTTPWTDARVNQDDIGEAVEFHDTLPATNSDRIPAELRGVYLKSQLDGRVRDLCSFILKETLCSDKGVAAITDPIRNKDSQKWLQKYSRVSRTSCLLSVSRTNSFAILKLDS